MIVSVGRQFIVMPRTVSTVVLADFLDFLDFNVLPSDFLNHLSGFLSGGSTSDKSPQGVIPTADPYFIPVPGFPVGVDERVRPVERVAQFET